MKNLLLFLFFIVLSITLKSQEVTGTEQSLIDSYIKANLSVKTESLNSAEVKTVFKGRFFYTELEYASKAGGGWSSSIGFFYIVEGEVSEMEYPTTDMEFPILKSLVKESFALKGEADAVLFEAALDKLYPVDEADMKSKRHFLKNKVWYFIRGKFFDDEKGFVVTPDANGRIQLIQHYLTLKKDK